MLNIDNRQQEIIDKFYTVEESFNGNLGVIKCMLYLFYFLSGFMLVLPFSSYEKFDFSLTYVPFMLNVMGCGFFIQGYITYAVQSASGMTNKQIRLKKIFFAIPVDMKQIKINIIKKLMKPQIIYGLLILNIRLGVSTSIYGRISIWDIVIVVGITLFPFILILLIE